MLGQGVTTQNPTRPSDKKKSETERERKYPSTQGNLKAVIKRDLIWHWSLRRLVKGFDSTSRSRYFTLKQARMTQYPNSYVTCPDLTKPSSNPRDFLYSTIASLTLSGATRHSSYKASSIAWEADRAA